MVRGEWATPLLLVRSLEGHAGGRLFELARPQPPPPSGALMLAAILLAGGILLTSASTWLVHSFEQLVTVVGLGCGAIRLLWSWWQRHPELPDPTAALAQRLARRPKTTALAVGSFVLVALWTWFDLGTSRLAAFPCQQTTPYGRDPTRWGVGYSFRSEVEPGWGRPWVDDLRSALTRNGFVPIPLGSEQDQRLQPGCMAWRIEAVGRHHASGAADTLVQVWRRGSPQPPIQMPSAPGEVQERVARELRELLGIPNIHLATATMDPESREANRQGLALYMAGNLGAAEERLARAVEHDLANPRLRNNLALVQFDLALQLRLRPENGENLPGKTRRKIDELFGQALRNLDRAIAEDAGNASYHYDRGRILLFLGIPEQARKAFEEALERWPTFPEASNDLAVVLLDEGKPDQAHKVFNLLETALAYAEPEDLRIRAAILKNFARAHWARGDLDEAWRALDTADCMVRRETLDDPLGAEILTLSASLQAELLGPASAAVAWRRYGAILASDTNVERRRHFFNWRTSHLRRPGQLSSSNPWEGRCLEGHFEVLGFP